MEVVMLQYVIQEPTTRGIEGQDFDPFRKKHNLHLKHLSLSTWITIFLLDSAGCFKET